MRQRPTYHRLFALVILAIILTTGCGTSKKAPREVNFTVRKNVFFDSLLAATKPFQSIYIDKFNLRVDYKGLLRTQKSSFYHVVDSVIYLKITSSFSIPVACFFALPKGILVIDRPNKIAYEASYETLEKIVGFPVSFSFLQNLIFGFHSDLNEVYKSNPNDVNFQLSNEFIVTSYNSKSSTVPEDFEYRYNFSTEDRTLKFLDIFKKTEQDTINALEVNYTYHKTSKTLPISSILLDFSYKSERLELEIEYKNPVFNQPVDVRIDSTYTFLPLLFDYE